MRSLIRPLLSVLALAATAAGCANSDVTGSNSQCVSSFTTPEIAGAEVAFQSGTTEVAESFKTSGASQPATIQLRLKPTGAPTGTLIVKIEGDLNGQPNSIPVETATLDSSTIRPLAGVSGDTGERYYQLTFPTSVLLAANTTYWIRVKGAPTFSTTNFVNWMGNNTGAGGTAQTSSDGTNFSSGVLGTGRAFFYLLGC